MSLAGYQRLFKAQTAADLKLAAVHSLTAYYLSLIGNNGWLKGVGYQQLAVGFIDVVCNVVHVEAVDDDRGWRVEPTEPVTENRRLM